eukprot:scaffold1707_cov88-Cylindrotheca_fusiformis.AAC.2
MKISTGYVMIMAVMMVTTTEGRLRRLRNKMSHDDMNDEVLDSNNHNAKRRNDDMKTDFFLATFDQLPLDHHHHNEEKDSDIIRDLQDMSMSGSRRLRHHEDRELQMSMGSRRDRDRRHLDLDELFLMDNNNRHLQMSMDSRRGRLLGGGHHHAQDYDHDEDELLFFDRELQMSNRRLLHEMDDVVLKRELQMST